MEVPARFELANESFADSCLTTWPRYHMKSGTLSVPDFFGAGDEARTRYLHLGKVALYRMSYTRIWCLRSESNQRHADFQSAALPTELQRRFEENKFSSLTQMRYMATPNGLEPSTSSVTGWRANRLHHRAMFYGGNNRARTCDLLLVRQMLSQLSYAPVRLRCVAHLSDVVHYTHKGGICQALFSKFFVQIFRKSFPRFSHQKSKIIRYFSEVRQYPRG